MNADGNDKDSDETEEQDGVDEDRDAAGLHVGELDRSALARELEQQARSQHNEQHRPNNNRPPVSSCHDPSSLFAVSAAPIG